MKPNLGKTDRVIRIVIALTLIVLYLTNVITGTIAILLLILSGIMLLVSAVGFCPLYLPFKINNYKK